MDEVHERYLQRTLQEAARGRGSVRPNPLVGALVVAGGRVVGVGHHRRYGEAHAEAIALEHAGDDARGATLYCNLEPCSYTAPDKHQPPCTERIIAAGISTVVLGQRDPNPRVRGNGVRMLEAAGVRVILADDHAPYHRFNDVFTTWMTLSRPFVHLKTAMSLDGRIATAGGRGEAVTDEQARADVHRLRADRDAVLVGIGTLLADDPVLTVRAADGPGGAEPTENDRTQPIAVVLDASLRTPVDSRLVRERADQFLLFASEWFLGTPAGQDRARRLEAHGVTVVAARANRAAGEGGVALGDVLQSLADRSIQSVLVEGGSKVVTAFIREGLFDRLTAYIAPRLFGRGVEAVGDLGIVDAASALHLEAVGWRTIGDQAVVDGYHPAWLDRTAFALEEVHDVHRIG
jgi:diaminohydroxyphosphoribosylaminopyrimidine deaminase/5-amino-6-(5-phosphoribosylamino)uracil reductase